MDVDEAVQDSSFETTHIFSLLKFVSLSHLFWATFYNHIAKSIRWTAIQIQHNCTKHKLRQDLAEGIKAQTPPYYITHHYHTENKEKSQYYFTLWFPNADAAKKYQKAITSNASLGGNPRLLKESETKELIATKGSSWMNSRSIEIHNLHRGIQREQIADHISQHGNYTISEKDIYLFHIDILSTANDWARIECSSNQEALQLVQTLNGTKLPNSICTLYNTISVGMSPERPTRFAKMGNVGRNATVQDIANLVRDHGKIENPPKSINLNAENKKKGRSGYAIIEFETDQDADQTVRNLNGIELKGRQISLQFVKDQILNTENKRKDKWEQTLSKEWTAFGVTHRLKAKYKGKQSGKANRKYAELVLYQMFKFWIPDQDPPHNIQAHRNRSAVVWFESAEAAKKYRLAVASNPLAKKHRVHPMSPEKTQQLILQEKALWRKDPNAEKAMKDKFKPKFLQKVKMWRKSNDKVFTKRTHVVKKRKALEKKHLREHQKNQRKRFNKKNRN